MMTYDEAVRGSVSIGTPDSEYPQLETFAGQAGVGWRAVGTELRRNGPAHSRVMEATRLLRQEVQPQFP